MGDIADNPFRPGSGTRPPYLAGREDVMSDLKMHLGRILGPTKEGDGVILFGPRGNGKTALLNELDSLAQEAGVTVRHLTAESLDKGVGGMCNSLLVGSGGENSPTSWKRNRWWHQAIWWVRATASSLASGLKLDIQRQARVESVLRALLKDGPLLVLVDEAQVLPPDMGRVLLHASQRCIGAKLPLLLVLAGTPSIFEALSATQASFWERFLKLRIGRLEGSGTARDALAIPAERAGKLIDKDAVELLVEESQLYPFFVQMLGAASWKVAMSAGHERITLQDAALGIEKSRDARQDFYAVRMLELSNRGILPEARAVSKAIRERGKGPGLPFDALDTVLNEAASTTGNSPAAVRRNLINLGLIWLMPDSRWEPGIPSFCDYLANMAPDDSGGRGPA